ncbi:hypothetical protein [Dyadobacter sp. LHD-138]|uniref:hypothetical protein n=1 Tax=Dyadobacter sp. LHD-138 TaxID=3071413 RepID=UPI0027E212E2|nr:hypothetical protein [Dyadobacter sp. LHD-138]MDQ6477914.1 hypothetical protein [Dyadobacter sp. LHD-138]
MKSNFIAILFLSLLASSCIKEETEVPPIVCDCFSNHVIGKDSLTSGSYLGLEINKEAADVYTALEQLRDTKNVQYLNVVNNIFSGLSQLKDRIPLYQSIFLDEQKGTDSGVQISFEKNKVSKIFLNSGRQLSQWPTSANAETAIRTGDDVTSLYARLLKINKLSAYVNKFERISLFTKDMSLKYDPILGQSPQWYFTHIPGDKLMDLIHLNFKDGKLVKINITHYKNN